jgi:catechol 2,3-dioxygenase-like lactoylglutathione lyase family enzyme
VRAGCHDFGVPLNHVALTVADRERSAAFYARHFGLDERIHADDHLLLLGSPDGSLLALSEGEPAAELARGNQFGFEREDPDEVRAARGRLRAAGVTEIEWQDDELVVRVQVADPDGYRVELFALCRTAGLRRPPRTRWTSFLADRDDPRPRILSERGNPSHRLRVEHNRDTLLVHLSDEDGGGWTVLAVDRASRRWAVAQAARQVDAAARAYARLYPGAERPAS